jgi:hypothetical protein
MVVVDIFIKTYHKDFVWLQYCLKSIQKFATGFRNVVIISDNDGHKIPNEYLIPHCEVFYVDIPQKQPTYVEHGIGYLWQQNIKLNWIEYSDADSVLVIDSDEIVTQAITPDSFKKNNKFVWNYKLWSEAGNTIRWKESTDFLIKMNTEYDAMVISGFVFQRDTTIALKIYLCSIHDTTNIWDIFVKYNMKTASEFNIFGSFIREFNRCEYTAITDYSIENCINFSIRKYWSWGGLSKEEEDIRNKILQ